VAKERCRLCGQSKAKCTCKVKGDIKICPVCCLALRSDGCVGCTYYEASIRYHSEKSERLKKEKPFIAPIYPDIDEEWGDGVKSLFLTLSLVEKRGGSIY